MCKPDEKPYHAVDISAFELDITEVTRGDYKKCIDASQCNTPSCDWDPVALADHPVTCVSWDDAKAYCTWAGKRLPTEAEWEKACRGDTGRVYPWGQSFQDNCSFANANLCSYDTKVVATHPTGASPYGVLDMSGNVAEWTADFYDAAYYATSPAKDPPGPASGGVRVHRGGSWNSAVTVFRCSARTAALPSSATDEIGFRCAK